MKASGSRLGGGALVALALCAVGCAARSGSIPAGDRVETGKGSATGPSALPALVESAKIVQKSVPQPLVGLSLGIVARGQRGVFTYVGNEKKAAFFDAQRLVVMNPGDTVDNIDLQDGTVTIDATTNAWTYLLHSVDGVAIAITSDARYFYHMDFSTGRQLLLVPDVLLLQRSTNHVLDAVGAEIERLNAHAGQ